MQRISPMLLFILFFKDIGEPRGAEQAQGQSKDLNSLRCSVSLKWLRAASLYSRYMAAGCRKQVGRGKLDVTGFANPLPSSAPMLVAACCCHYDQYCAGYSRRQHGGCCYNYEYETGNKSNDNTHRQ